jgi:chemotaxis response regulator CheB
MPQDAIAAGVVDTVLSTEQIGGRLAALVREG